MVTKRAAPAEAGAVTVKPLAVSTSVAPVVTHAQNSAPVCECGCGAEVSIQARFAKGHWARKHGKKSLYETRECVACGKAFRIVRTSERTVCTKKCRCVGSQIRGVLTDLVLSRETRRLAALRAIRLSRWKYRTALREANRSQDVESAARMRDWAMRVHAQEIGEWLEALPALERSEATELLANQEKDARRRQIQYGQSLDQRRVGTNDDGSWLAHSLGAEHFDDEDDR